MVDKQMQPLQSVLDALDAGLIVLDRDRRIVQWNAWMASASGHAAADVLGEPLDNVFSGVVA